jgi:hypothetical protein
MLRFWQEVYAGMPPPQKACVDQLAREGIETETAIELFMAAGRRIDLARDLWREFA